MDVGMHSERKERSLVYRTLAASAATAAVFSFVAATAWGETQYPEVGSYKCEKGEVISTVISPDGKFIAISCYDSVSKTGSIQVIKIGGGTGAPASGTVPGDLVGVGGRKFDLGTVQCVNQKGQTVWCVKVIADHKTIIFDPEDGRIVDDKIGSGGNNSSENVVFNPGVVIGSPSASPSSSSSPSVSRTPTPVAVVEMRSGTIQFRDKDGKPIGPPIRVHFGRGASSLVDMCFGAGGQLVTVGEDKFVCVVDVNTHKPVRIPIPGGRGTTVDVTPGGKIGIGTTDGQVYVIEPGGKKVGDPIDSREGVIPCVKFDEKGNLIVGGEDGIVKIWDPVTKTCVATIDRGSGVTDITTGPGGMVGVGGKDGEVKVYQPTPTPPPKATSPTTPTSPTKTPAATPTTPPKTSSTPDPEMIDPIVSVAPAPSSTTPPADPSMVQVNAWPY